MELAAYHIRNTPVTHRPTRFLNALLTYCGGHSDANRCGDQSVRRFGSRQKVRVRWCDRRAMPKLSSETVTIMDGDIRLTRRPNSRAC